MGKFHNYNLKKNYFGLELRDKIKPCSLAIIKATLEHMFKFWAKVSKKKKKIFEKMIKAVQKLF